MVPAVTWVYLFFFFLPSDSTIDITLSEYQYIADHLTEEECYQLVAALHFRSFELPKEISAAERRLPEDVSCLELLLHWNSSPREGRGQTHVEVRHRLSQIGRDDLAQWISKSVFHELSKDLKSEMNRSEVEETTFRISNVTEFYDGGKVWDEAAWWKVDSAMLIFIVFASVGIFLSFLWVLLLYYRKKYLELTGSYHELSLCEH